MSGKLHGEQLPDERTAFPVNLSFLSTHRFWSATLVALLATGLLFAWELNLLIDFGLPGPPRFAPSTREITLAILIALLFSLNVGLLVWNKRYGVCSIGTKRATGAGGTIGAFALICPICALWTVGFLGLSLSLAFLAPFVPVLQVVAIILLAVSLFLLMPKKVSSSPPP